MENGVNLVASTVTRRVGMGNRSLDDVVDPAAVVRRYRDGATVSLQGLQHTDPELARLANNLALELDHRTQVNAYLSPSNARGLDLHLDFHDVFVVQVRGVKRWRVWDPLPDVRHPVKGLHRATGPTLDELGDPSLDLTMRPGDRLYLPRGFLHAAETIDVASEHLTVGLVPLRWDRVLHRCIDAEVAGGRFAESLPAGLLSPGAVAALGSAVAFPSLPADAVARWAGSSLQRWMVTEIWRRQPLTRVPPRDLPRPGDGAPLHWTPGPLIWLTTEGGRARLGFGDRRLDLPIGALGYLSSLVAADPAVDLASIEADLDASSRGVVLRRMLGEGLVAHD
ncbi:MAG: cupin domain-containing protein [Microthrixaceae bacterium]